MASAINPAYRGMVKAIRQAYRQDPKLPTVALGQFLTPAAFQKIKREMAAGWKRVSIPDQYCHEARPSPGTMREVRSFAEAIAGKAPLKEGSRRFGHRDYTLMHDELPEQPGVLALLFLDDWDARWGGQLVFMRDGMTLGQFTPSANTLLVVERKKGVRSFVQYINHRAGKRKLMMLG